MRGTSFEAAPASGGSASLEKCEYLFWYFVASCDKSFAHGIVKRFVEVFVKANCHKSSFMILIWVLYTFH